MATVNSPPFSVKIRAAAAATPPDFELNINNGAWWPNSTRTDMTYSSSHLHTSGRSLEFNWAQHARPAGDHTSVRWTDFTASGAPTMGYYWPENDTLIKETDNFPTVYLPWRQWCWYKGWKIIDIANGVPIFRNLSTPPESSVVALTIGSAEANQYHSNYNPSCLWNPDSNYSIWFGGGYFTGNGRLGAPPSIKIVDDNPNYPATDARPIRVRQISYNLTAPFNQRITPKVGDWIYWGGGMEGLFDGPIGGHSNFYRIRISTLLNNLRVTQEQLPSIPATVNGYFRLMVADVPRRRIITVNNVGVFVYQIPADHSANGTWQGPYSIPNWRSVIAQEDLNQWWGVIGTHRSDLNQTFFRFNLSRRWNRIRWKN